MRRGAFTHRLMDHLIGLAALTRRIVALTTARGATVEVRIPQPVTFSARCDRMRSAFALAKFGSAVTRREAHLMKPSITAVAAGAMALAGAFAAQAQSITVNPPSMVEAEGLPRLPSYFKNCEEPLPWYCTRPSGLLWFGSLQTLERDRGLASFRARREFARRR